ncbi:MAG: bifunctional 2-C-methyl-D-erythritol 4-phosphate cytidylyltransferase/2-C-methyl-D-erythritol 2,4-cyclodiphosphate synthase [Stappiaceae bacterium]
MSQTPNNKITALIVAAGRGSRLVDGTDNAPKQYRRLGNKSILARTLSIFLTHPRIDSVLTVIHEADQTAWQSVIDELAALLPTATMAKLSPACTGGSTRQQSVCRGLEHLAPSPPSHVLIHDAARPFVSDQVIGDVIQALVGGDVAVLSAIETVDTLKRSTDQHFVEETLSRTDIWQAQTPQGFQFQPIRDAHLRAANESIDPFTDDASIAEWSDLPVRLIAGDKNNIKITTRDDLEQANRRSTMEIFAQTADIRIGTGFDVHAFEKGDGVTLGGITIDHDHTLKGHSDADVVLHTLTDAIFGALAEGDIGDHFPPSDDQWKGAASDIFLKAACERVSKRGGLIAHLDATIMCEHPKIGPHRLLMRQSIADICNLTIDRVSVKATTTEKLGFTGRGEGIACMATATIRLPLT